VRKPLRRENAPPALNRKNGPPALPVWGICISNLKQLMD
jgi:hypothetical protein